MLGWISRLFGSRSRPSHQQRLVPMSRYDAAQTADDNRLHWANADGLSAIAANSPEVRRVLRNRSRYEDDNNPNATGLIGGLATECVGTGPRLQLQIRGGDTDFGVPLPEDLPREIERRFRDWCKAISLTDALTLAVLTEVRDGEVFLFMFMNSKLESPVQLAVRLYEGDQIATPDIRADQAVDGIVFDSLGNPVEYHVLKQHPGDIMLRWGPAAEYDRVPARQMIHLFRIRRPSQARGVPALTSSLPTYAILRRYTLATLLSAEAQARINAVIEQQHALGDEEEEDGTGEQIQFAGTHMLTLSSGQTAKTLPHTSPPPNYREFKAENLTDGGRPLGAPRNVSTGSSAEYNYSSGRLDQQQWQKGIRTRRERLERLVLDRLFVEWARLALLTPGYLPPGTPPIEQWEWRWRWDGFVSIDPVKDANAASERLANGTSSLDRECGELGEDWEDVQDQRLAEEVREHRRREALGLPPKAIATRPPTRPPTQPKEPTDASE